MVVTSNLKRYRGRGLPETEKKTRRYSGKRGKGYNLTAVGILFVWFGQSVGSVFPPKKTLTDLCTSHDTVPQAYVCKRQDKGKCPDPFWGKQMHQPGKTSRNKEKPADFPHSRPCLLRETTLDMDALPSEASHIQAKGVCYK